MPPASNMRKATGAAVATVQANDAAASRRRTSSGRAIRANTTRPSNYYARPLGSFGAANPPEPIQDDAAIGFYPAIQYFSDAITALPREVMRQYTLVREVEAKIHGPNLQIGELIDAILEQPTPPRKSGQTAVSNGQGLLSFTAHNSTFGSTNPSVINGVAPSAGNHSTQNSVAGSLNSDDMAIQESEEELTRRKAFHHLKIQLHTSLANLDEKNGLLAEANRVLSQQLLRIDSIVPQVESEISEEARLGSMTHWAYSDNRQKKQTVDTFVNRRNVAATNNLAAAANAVHENEIQQARRDATRETAREKKARAREQDSDFDDKPRKPNNKLTKMRIAAQLAAAGSNASNGEPVKRRRIDKTLNAPAMERTASGNTKATRPPKETPRSAPPVDPAKRATKIRPAHPKKRGPNSVQASPALPSSPLQAGFAFPAPEMLNSRKPQSTKTGQSILADHRQEKMANEDVPAAPLAMDKSGGEKINGKRKGIDAVKEPEAEVETIATSTEFPDEPNHEGAIGTNPERPHISRSTSTSAKVGQNSKTATPRNESFGDAPAMLRTRSTRTARPNGNDENVLPDVNPGGPPRHRREYSNSHLVKQLAPFNRSPDFERHVPEGEDGTNELAERSPRRRPPSRRNTGSALIGPPPASPLQASDGVDVKMADDSNGELATYRDFTAHEPVYSPTNLADERDPPIADPEVVPVEEPAPIDDGDEMLEDDDDEDEDEGSEPGDPDDPNEQKYCYCNRGSYGEMIACDNDDCAREWFHLGCTDLTEAPDTEDQWFCADCQPLFVRPRKTARGGRATR